MSRINRKQRSLFAVLIVSALVLLAGCATTPPVAASAATSDAVQEAAAAPSQQSSNLPEQIADMTARMQQMKNGDMPAAETMAQMSAMMTQMSAMMAALPEADNADVMGRQMMGLLGNMMGMTQNLLDETMPMGDMSQMMGMMAQMTGMMSQMQGMTGAGMMGATGVTTGTVPMGDMSQMMGMMAQMMGMMSQMQGMMGDVGMGQMGIPMPNQGSAMTDRQAEVAARGTEVMPFDLEQTIHVFIMLDSGGLQQVLVKAGADVGQVTAIQMHLTEEAERFRQGDFGDQAQIHGEDMPGLAILRQRAGEMDIRYTALDNGAQLQYISDDPELVTAIHDWFGAQLTDHGVHAAGSMPLDDMSQMMGDMSQMMAMMSQMQGMMGATGIVTSTMPTTGTMPMGDMSQMMGMMAQMMGMMSQMQGMMGATGVTTETMPMMGATGTVTGTMPMDGKNQMMPMMPQLQGGGDTAVTPEAGVPMQEQTQTAEVGAITVKVTPVDLTGQDGNLDFTVAFDTHSVELGIDFSKSFVLQVGDKEILPTAWESPSSGSHHVSGTVSFPATDPNGAWLLSGATQVSLAVRIPNREETSTFTWELNR